MEILRTQQDWNNPELLICQFRQGDPRALESLFKKFRKDLIGFACRFITEKEVAEDIVTEVMIKLWNRHEAFDSLPCIKTWLYVATRNACINQLRYNRLLQKKHKLLVHLLQEQQFNDVAGMQKDKAEQLDQLLAAINALPPQLSRVMQLSYAGTKLEQIALLLNLSLQSVKNYKTMATKLLRKQCCTKPLLKPSYAYFISN